MPSEAAVAVLSDIAYHIDLALRFAAGFDYERFRDEDVAAQLVWESLQVDLPPLRGVIERELTDRGG